MLKEEKKNYHCILLVVHGTFSFPLCWCKPWSWMAVCAWQRRGVLASSHKSTARLVLEIGSGCSGTGVVDCWNLACVRSRLNWGSSDLPSSLLLLHLMFSCSARLRPWENGRCRAAASSVPVHPHLHNKARPLCRPRMVARNSLHIISWPSVVRYDCWFIGSQL